MIFNKDLYLTQTERSEGKEGMILFMKKTCDELVDILSELLKHPENEYIEFKRAENNFETDKLGKYFSAMSNEATLKDKQYGWIIFGIDDKTHKVLGTNYCIENNFNSIKNK